MTAPDDREQRRALALSAQAKLSDLKPLADEWPDEVLANPALPLLALEDPAGYEQVVSQARFSRANGVVNAGIKELREKRHRSLFACDCVERVLALYTRRYPGDPRPAEGVEAARRYAGGQGSRRALSRAQHAARAASVEAAADADRLRCAYFDDPARVDAGEVAAAEVASHVADAAFCASAHLYAAAASKAAMVQAETVFLGGEEWEVIFKKEQADEREWQAARVRYYLERQGAAGGLGRRLLALFSAGGK
jgi:hypothetical protein